MSAPPSGWSARGDDDVSAPPSSEAWLQRIFMLVEMHRWDDAAPALQSLLAVDPDNWRALCLLAQTCCGLHDFDQALTAALAAMALNPDSDWPQRLASIAQRCLKHPTEAVQHAEEAVRLAPHLADAHRVLAQALVLSGDLDGAADAALRALELSPLEAGSHRLIGVVAFERNELEAAESAFTHALSIDPDDAATHHELARVVLRRSQVMPGRLAESVEGFARALAADPRQSVSRRNLVLVLRIFLARGAYFLFLAAAVTAYAYADSTHPAVARILGVVALVVPLGFVTRFLRRLSPPLRAVLVDTVRADRVLTAAILLEAVTVMAEVSGAVAGVPGLLITAVVGAVGARILVYTRLHGTLMAAGQFRVRTTMLCLLAISLACLSIIGFAAAGTSGQDSSLGGVLVGGVFGLAAVAVVVVIVFRWGGVRVAGHSARGER